MSNLHTISAGELLDALTGKEKQANQMIVQTGKKLLPALFKAKPAVKALPGAADELAVVGKHIDDVAPVLKPVKGRVVDPIVPHTPTGYGAPAAQVAPRAGRLARAGEAIGGAWNGLSAGTRGGLKATALLGTGGVLGHMQGKSTGTELGLTEGATRGFDAGLQAGTQHAMASDPGVLGRLLEVFTGRQISPAGVSDPEIAYRRQEALRRILSGNGGVKSASAKKLLAAMGVGATGGGVLGHAIGKTTGFRDGAGQGYDDGVTAPPPGPSVDPGMLQRLIEVFTGRQDTAKSHRDLNVERVVRGEIVNGKPVTP